MATELTTIGDRIRHHRRRLALSQEDLAYQAGIGNSQISKYENNRERPGKDILTALAWIFGINIEELTVGHIPSGMEFVDRRATDSQNPKPIRLGGLRIENVYLMVGNHTEPLELSVRYKHEPLQIPPKIETVFDELVALKKADALNIGYPFFNGPNTRMIRATQENSRQLSSGEEQKGFVLELGPVSWEEYTVMNGFLDRPICEGRNDTIRKVFAHNHTVYRHSPDLRSVPLSNILTVVSTPITSDGFGVIQHRSSKGVSSDFGLVACGINENIHRYKDEAAPHNLHVALNPVPSGTGVDANYLPTGVPKHTCV